MNRKIAVWTVAAAALLLAAPHAFAQTAAGTKVTNTANVSYKIGSVTQTAPPAGTADFFVDRKVDLSVSNGTYHTGVSPGSTNQAVSYLVTNNTNDVIDVALTATNMAIGTVYKGADLVGNTDDQTATESVGLTFKLYNDDGGTPGDYDGTNTELTKDGSQYFIDQMAAGATKTIIVVAQTIAAAGLDSDPSKVQDGDILVVNLTGVAHSGYDDQTGAYNSGTHVLDWVVDSGTNLGDALTDDAANTDVATVVDNVFADSADDDSSDAQHNGQDASYAAYEIGGADITVTKRSVVYWDPINQFTKPKAIPGAMVLYCITVANTGTATADEVAVSDTVPTGTTFEQGGTDIDPVTGGTQTFDPDGAGTDYPALSSSNSLRFTTSNTCTSTDWDEASNVTTPVAGSSVEDSDSTDPAVGVETDGAIGNYNGTAVSTTVNTLSGTTGITTTMFLVKID